MEINFTLQQADAADYRALDACVVAGPGSGKTTVLVERYRALIEDRGFEPRNILAITFTEKAAANMKVKLAELFAHDQLRLRELETTYVSTIHGFCARVLRENAIAAGVDPRFSVLDARESEELQYSCLNAALDELVTERRTESLALIEALQTPGWVAGDLRNAYDAIRSAGKSIAEVRGMGNPGSAGLTPAFMADALGQLIARWPSQLTAARQTQRAELLEWIERLSAVNGESVDEIVRVVKSCPLHLGKVPPSEKESLELYRDALPNLIAFAVDRETAACRALVFDVLQRFEELYAERKQERSALDFNDLERLAVALLRRDVEVRDRIRSQFRQVMLDEFQDINQQQWDLIELIRARDVFFAVGDVNQSIYGFRHARPEIFESYRDAIAGARKHSVDLLHNFRSRNEILRCVEALLQGCDGIRERELVAASAFAAKQIPSVEALKIHAAGDDEELAAKEARWIAHRILSLRGTLAIGPAGRARMADFADFAVLCRAGDSMKPILEAFDHAGIPYVSGRRQSFLLSREGRDIAALLHTIANPRDTIALATLLRSPLVALGDETLLRLRLLAGSLSGGLNSVAHDAAKLADFEPAEAGKVERFIRNLKSWRDLQPVVSLDLLLVRALSDCGFDWTPGTTAGDNVESFLHLARTRGSRALPEFLREIESLEKAVNLESDLADKDQGNCVQVMTAHAAKGLEFPVTIIAAMDKGTQRNSAPVTFTPAFGLGLKWSDRTAQRGNKGIADSWQIRNEEELESREKAESNRLLYVAMTRAEEHLILSCSRGRSRSSNWVKLVDKVFRLDGTAPSSEPFRVDAGAFAATVYATANEPPLSRSWDVDAAAAARVLTIDRPAVTDRHDSTVNVTSLTVFADCPRKYYLQRYLGWNGGNVSFDPEDLPAEDDADDMSAADLGSAVHEILAGKDGAEYPAEARRLAQVFRSSELGRRAAGAARASREWDFIIDVDGTLVRGTVDLWFEEGGEIVLIDYKTDAIARPDAYRPQLALYGLALERALGKRPSQAWLHFLRVDSMVEVPIDDGAIGHVGKLLADLRDAQDVLRFDLREAPRCRTCQFYRSLCPAA